MQGPRDWEPGNEKCNTPPHPGFANKCLCTFQRTPCWRNKIHRGHSGLKGCTKKNEVQRKCDGENFTKRAFMQDLQTLTPFYQSILHQYSFSEFNLWQNKSEVGMHLPDYFGFNTWALDIGLYSNNTLYASMCGRDYGNDFSRKETSGLTLTLLLPLHKQIHAVNYLFIGTRYTYCHRYLYVRSRPISVIGISLI